MDQWVIVVAIFAAGFVSGYATRALISLRRKRQFC
jgi:hypothetical protein